MSRTKVTFHFSNNDTMMVEASMSSEEISSRLHMTMRGSGLISFDSPSGDTTLVNLKNISHITLDTRAIRIATLPLVNARSTQTATCRKHNLLDGIDVLYFCFSENHNNLALTVKSIYYYTKIQSYRFFLKLAFQSSIFYFATSSYIR